MVKHETPLWMSILAVLAIVLFVAVAAHDMFEAPEVVIEEVTELSCAEFIPEAVICPEVVVCAEPVICEEPIVCEVIDEDLQEEQDVRELVLSKIDELIVDEDFIPTLESLYECDITDEDDLLSIEIESSDVDWDVDDEEGTFEVELEAKFYCDDEREDYKVRDLLLVGEFDDNDLEDFEDGDDLESFDLEDE